MSRLSIPSVLRQKEHEALSGIELHGSVLDVGGDSNSAYRSVFQGTYTFTTINIDTKTRPDIVHDLEQSLPLESASFDGVLLINVLEHIFNYRELLTESVRVLRPGGQLVAVVPFLFPVHPSPHDYHRFTAEALQKECALAGLEGIEIIPLGDGIFSARYLLLDRLLPWPLRALGYVSIRHLARLLDVVFASVARSAGKEYRSSDYALGYCLTARKP